MYTYRNTRTGVEFSSVCECFGEDIEKVSPPEASPPETPKKGKRKNAKE